MLPFYCGSPPSPSRFNHNRKENQCGWLPAVTFAKRRRFGDPTNDTTFQVTGWNATLPSWQAQSEGRNTCPLMAAGFSARTCYHIPRWRYRIPLLFEPLSYSPEWLAGALPSRHFLDLAFDVPRTRANRGEVWGLPRMPPQQCADRMNTHIERVLE